MIRFHGVDRRSHVPHVIWTHTLPDVPLIDITLDASEYRDITPIIAAEKRAQVREAGQ